MFKPNIDCVVYTDKNTHDLYGKPTPKVKSRERCAVVRLLAKAVRSPVRQDTSPSRGAAQQEEAEVILLFPTTSKITFDDVVELLGMKVRVSAISPRLSVTGQLDHYHVEAMIWSGT